MDEVAWWLLVGKQVQFYPIIIILFTFVYDYSLFSVYDPDGDEEQPHLLST
jgi:hypothetical protein